MTMYYILYLFKVQILCQHLGDAAPKEQIRNSYHIFTLFQTVHVTDVIY